MNHNHSQAGRLSRRLSERIAEHRLSARKTLGQHFILDRNLNRRIVDHAGPLDGATVIEIGPGPGGLTEALLQTTAKRVIAIERDQRCIVALQSLVDKHLDRLQLIAGDARHFSIPDIIGHDIAHDADYADEGESGTNHKNIMVIANLPYNIATFLLLRWLGDRHMISQMVLMFQKEVAQRLLAIPGDKAYGRLSVLVQWQCHIRKLMPIAARAFTPPPKVDSILLSFKPRQQPLYVAEENSLSRVTKAAFGQRRKMLRRSLKPLEPQGVSLAAEAGINPDRRGETLDIGEFCALARALQAFTSSSEDTQSLK